MRHAMEMGNEGHADIPGRDSHCPFTRMRQRRAGVSLIEILVAIMLLVVVAVGALAQFSYGLAGVNTQGSRRAALERARERLEEVMATPFAQVSPPVAVNPNRVDGWYWLPCVAGVCAWSATNPNETVAVGDLGPQSMECLVRWINDPTLVGSPLPDALEFSVKVRYAPGVADNELQRVYLRSLSTAP